MERVQSFLEEGERGKRVISTGQEGKEAAKNFGTYAGKTFFFVGRG